MLLVLSDQFWLTFDLWGINVTGWQNWFVCLQLLSSSCSMIHFLLGLIFSYNDGSRPGPNHDTAATKFHRLCWVIVLGCRHFLSLSSYLNQKPPVLSPPSTEHLLYGSFAMLSLFWSSYLSLMPRSSVLLTVDSWTAKFELILNLMAATCLQNVGTGPCFPLCSISSSFNNICKHLELRIPAVGPLGSECRPILVWYCSCSAVLDLPAGQSSSRTLPLRSRALNMQHLPLRREQMLL